MPLADGRCASIAALNARVMPTTMPEIRRFERDIPRIPEGYSPRPRVLAAAEVLSTEPTGVRLGKVHASHL